MATNGRHRTRESLISGGEPDERDRAAEERDRAADERDRAADVRDRTRHLWSASERAQAGRDRNDAATDRAEAWPSSSGGDTVEALIGRAGAALHAGR